jgi:hypothetical protein
LFNSVTSGIKRNQIVVNNGSSLKQL